jgi:predicted ArsR family transcriptional regulator
MPAAADGGHDGRRSMNPDDFDSHVARVAALGDPVRRALYRFVVAQPGPVNRDQAAAGVGVPRHVAKFHLDKLESDGLLEAEFSRPPGRGGPGAGRPAKLYRRSTRELVVSLPERRYDVAGRVMAQAITDAARDGVPIADALHRAARDAGRSLGQDARRQAGPRPTQAALLEAAHDVLGPCGFEPRRDDGGLILANCPFHALAQEYTDLVCGMNLDVMEGLLGDLGPSNLEARLEPAPGRCCVTLCRGEQG